MWTRSDLAALLDAPDAFSRVGPLHDVPYVVVDLRGAHARAATGDSLTRPAPASLPVVVIGIADPENAAPAACDLVVRNEVELGQICTTVDASRHASTVLVQLLRLQVQLTPLDALAAESLAYATLQGGAEFGHWLASRGRRVRTPDTAPRVRVEHTDGGATAVVTLDRPRLFNLYDAAMRDAMVDAMRALVADQSVTRIQLRGAGKAFCAGGDLSEFGTTRDTTRAHLIRSSANVAPLLMAAAPKLHAHVHGAAVGAGCELAAFAMHVTATADATFALPEVSMGLVPGAGGTVSVTHRIGRHRAAWMALSGTRIDAAIALAWGLVDEVV